MGILSAMSTAIAGLESNGQMLSIVSDNIVNANTTGFKGSRAEFQSILAADLKGSATGGQVGNGARVGGITGLFTQGSISRTERSTDLAINGDGFFILRNDQGVSYTRDGSLRFDREGYLTNLAGSRVQSYGVGADGRISGKLDDIRIPATAVPAQATNRIEMHVNLDARQEIGPALDPKRPEETSNFSTATQVFDSIGNAHAVSVYFNRTSTGNWQWTAMADGADMVGGELGVPAAIAHGELAFDATGKLQSSQQQLDNGSFSNGAIPNQELVFDFGDPLDTQGTGQKGTTQYGSKSALYRNVQDGYSSGTLADTVIDTEGVITGVYSNGQSKLLGQLALARFEATERMIRSGENQFKDTAESGQAIIGKAKSGGRGGFMTKSLESSNIDLAKEFVDMIKAQRGFQASAKSITSANEMMEEVMNLRTR